MYEERLEQAVEEALQKELDGIQSRIHEAAERILEQKLAELGYDDDFIDRYQAAREFGVPVWKIRDLQLKGKAGPTVTRGKKVYGSRRALEEALRGAA